ncbi:MAG: DUF2281 domain-containing protein [Prochlorothrix sp.]
MTPHELFTAAQTLTPRQQLHLILQLLRHWLTHSLTPTKTTPPARTPNLHPGACIFGDDFDDPLPDRFWLGEE